MRIGGFVRGHAYGDFREKRRGKMLNKQTLCWDCANAVNGCKWSMNGEPVDGWTAEETELKCKGQSVRSFHVISCPEFIRDAERKERTVN